MPSCQKHAIRRMIPRGVMRCRCQSERNRDTFIGGVSDNKSERLVQNALENMMKHRTSIVIAHRLSTIQNADLIVVMQKGRIVEQGTHSELIQKNGMYKRLVEMQTIE